MTNKQINTAISELADRQQEINAILDEIDPDSDQAVTLRGELDETVAKIDGLLSEIPEPSKTEIVSIVRNTQEIDVNKEFRFYKYAIPEHDPIPLSNGKWFHVYRLTKYEDGAHGDPDEEQDAIDREINL